jgi:hypothetical protein
VRRSAINGELDIVYQRLRDIASSMADEPGRGAMDRLLEHADHLRHESLELMGAGIRLRTVPEEGEGGTRREARLAVSLTLAAVGALAIPLLVPALRRSPLAWGVSGAIATFALGALALPQRARERMTLAARDALALVQLRRPSEIIDPLMEIAGPCRWLLGQDARGGRSSG